jgi:hypothetical protein
VIEKDIPIGIRDSVSLMVEPLSVVDNSAGSSGVRAPILPARFDKYGRHEYHGGISGKRLMQRKPPGLVDRAAMITVLLPPIHDYVMMSHAGATSVAPVGPGSPDTWRAFLFQVGLPWRTTFTTIYISSPKLSHRL